MTQGIARKCAFAMVAGAGFYLVILANACLAAASPQHSTVIWILDDDEGPSDPGTAEGDEINPGRPGVAPPSEDDTQQDARPKAPENGRPEYGGCIFEKRDLGLII